VNRSFTNATSYQYKRDEVYHSIPKLAQIVLIYSNRQNCVFFVGIYFRASRNIVNVINVIINFILLNLSSIFSSRNKTVTFPVQVMFRTSCAKFT